MNYIKSRRYCLLVTSSKPTRCQRAVAGKTEWIMFLRIVNSQKETSNYSIRQQGHQRKAVPEYISHVIKPETQIWKLSIQIILDSFLRFFGIYGLSTRALSLKFSSYTYDHIKYRNIL